MDGGHAESPQRASPPVAEAGLVGPATRDVHPVVAAPVRRDGSQQEVEVATPQPVQHRRRIGLAADHDEAPRHVVDAVAVFRARVTVQRVLEKAALVGHPHKVVEDRDRLRGSGGHAATLALIS